MPDRRRVAPKVPSAARAGRAALRAVRTAFWAAAILGLPAATPSCAAEYRLGPQDKLRVTVAEWRPSRGEAISWTPLNAEFTISSAGMLALPLIGTLKADLLTVEQLGESISEQLQAKLGLVGRPSTSVEIVRFRPFYITGDVANPGEFPYRPDLTVLKAVALAGGLYRPLGASAASFERDALLARGDLRVLLAEQMGLQAKKARLDAEASDGTGIVFPSALLDAQAGRDAADAVREERLIFEARRNALNAKVTSLNQAKILLENEITTLSEKDANLEKQLRLAIAERENVKALADKGLAVTSRQTSTEQNVAQMESTRLDVGLARVRAQQDRARIDRDIIALRDQRRAEILAELRQAEGRLSEIREKFTTGERLAFNAEVTAPEAEAETERRRRLPPSFSIVRTGPDGPREIEASFGVSVEPGDVVQVRRARSLIGRGPVAERASDRSVASVARPANLP